MILGPADPPPTVGLEGDYSPRSLAGELVAVLDATGVGVVDLVAHSAGGAKTVKTLHFELVGFETSPNPNRELKPTERVAAALWSSCDEKEPRALCSLQWFYA